MGSVKVVEPSPTPKVVPIAVNKIEYVGHFFAVEPTALLLWFEIYLWTEDTKNITDYTYTKQQLVWPDC